MNGSGYSFVIPAYNDCSGLKRHFEYFNKVHAEVQLVIVDDCSTDDTASLVANTVLRPNVELLYHRQEVNSGPAAARNKGISLASREYIVFLDADDVLADCFFGVAALAPFAPNVDFVLFKHHLSLDSDVLYTYDMHRVDRSFFSRAIAPFPNQVFRLRDRPDALTTIAFPWNKIYKRAFIERAHISFPDLRMHEDVTPHWQSFMRCDMFGVLDWAPPLLTHFEVPDGERATQYVGEKRMGVFDELASIEVEMMTHADAQEIAPFFSKFCNDLFDWMTGPLCDTGEYLGSTWAVKYSNAVEEFWEKSLSKQQEAKS